MKRISRFAGGMAAAAVVLLSGCTTSARLASSGTVDDLYTTHDIKAIAAAEARQAEAIARYRQQQAEIVDQTIAQYIDQAGEDGSYSENILSLTYEDSFERRLRGFESLSYRMPDSYYNYRYGDHYFETQTYDPMFYNVIVMGDQVWVEPRYITSMFGNWGAPVNINLGWGWNRWYRPYWDWYYTPSWGWGFGWGYDPYWASSWGWRGWYDPYYWHYPGYWGWGGHNHWGGGHWGGGSWGHNDNYARLSSSNRRGGTPGSVIGSGSTGRYSSGTASPGSSSRVSSTSGYRRGSASTAINGVNASTPSGGTATFRRGSSSGNVGSSSGAATINRGSSSSSSSSGVRRSGTPSSSGTTSRSTPSSGSSYRSSSPSSGGGGSSRSSGSSSSSSSSGGARSGSRR